MKKFEDMSDADLKKVIHFAEKVLDAREEATVNYAAMPADKSVLDEAEARALAYAKAKRERKTTSTFYDKPAVDEDGSVVERVREWKTRRKPRFK